MSLSGMFPETGVAEEPQVELHLGVRPAFAAKNTFASTELAYASDVTNDAGQPFLYIWKVNDRGCLHFEYEDGVEFWLDENRRNVWAIWPERLTVEDAASYLVGPVLGFILRLRGVICLHASAVTVDNRCVAFVGPSGAGKSTTAAAFARRGHAVISDDIVAVNEGYGSFYVTPAYPHVCLWPDAVQMLYGSADLLPKILPDWEKRRLMLDGTEARFEERTLPLAAIYLLGERCSEGAPRVETVRLQAALLSLVSETYAYKIVNHDMRAREFGFLSALVERVPIRRIRAHEDAVRLDELLDLVLNDIKCMPPTIAAKS